MLLRSVPVTALITITEGGARGAVSWPAPWPRTFFREKTVFIRTLAPTMSDPRMEARTRTRTGLSKEARIVALLLVLEQLCGVSCEGNMAGKQQALSGSPLPVLVPSSAGGSPLPLGPEVSSSSPVSSSRRGGERRAFEGAPLGGVIVSSRPKPKAATADKPTPRRYLGRRTLGRRVP